MRCNTRGRRSRRPTIERHKTGVRHSRTSHPIRVLIVHGQELVRLGVRAMLDGEEDLLVVGEAGRLASTMSETRRVKPDVVLIDPRLLNGSGAEVCRLPCEAHPTIRIIVMTMPNSPSAFTAVADVGVYRYELKHMTRPELLSAIRIAAGRASDLHSEMTDQTFSLLRKATGGLRESRLHVLSPQEQRMMPLVADGKTNKEIAAELVLSVKTVRNYLANIFVKLRITRRAQAAALYVRDFQRHDPLFGRFYE
jgi:two-component system, NarL family, response regulator DevR